MRNVGVIDRAVRLALAAVLAYVSLGTGLAGGGLVHWLLLVVAAVLALTAAVGRCPLYRLVGLDSCSRCAARPD